jgi:Family of unknown function (DUF6527)
MRLIDLGPNFLKIIDASDYRLQDVDDIKQADGIRFLCPKCLHLSGHTVICWQPHVPPEIGFAGPGRWPFTGTGYNDLTLTPSIFEQSDCKAHFFIKNGEVTLA